MVVGPLLVVQSATGPGAAQVGQLQALERHSWCRRLQVSQATLVQALLAHRQPVFLYMSVTHVGTVG